MGQSTSIGQASDASNVGNATNGIQAQNAQLNAQYSGMNPGATALQTQATNNAIAQSTGMLASAKGISPALAARMAGQNAAQATQQGANNAIQNNNTANLQAQGLISQNLSGLNSNAQSGINNINSANASTDNGSASAVSGAIGGVASGASAAAGAGAGKYNGGVIGYATGGQVAPQFDVQQAPNVGAGIAQAGAPLGKSLGSLFSSPQSSLTPDPGANANQMATQNAANVRDLIPAPYAKGGKIPDKKNVPVMLSPGERKLSPEDAKAVAKGKLDALRTGQKVPGKAPVKGDSPKNDIVKDSAQAGSVIIPRSVLDSPNPHKAASKFVAAALMHHKLTKKYGK